jgi:hypothetical protein
LFKKEVVKISLIKIVDNNEAFRFCDGKVAYSISDLSHFIETVSQETFSYHMNAMKNDFANWIEYVFNEKGLAIELRLCRTKEEAINMIDIAVHGELSKTQEKKEIYNKESHYSQEKEQKELKEKLEHLKLQLKEKIELAEKHNNAPDVIPSFEFKELEYKPVRRNIIKEYAVAWMILCFIIGVIAGVIITRSLI